MSLPLVHLRVPVPSARLPNAGAMLTQARWGARSLGSFLPPAERLALYGGLAAMAVAGILEWPVAAAVGAGVYVASHSPAGRAASPAQ